MIHRFLLFRKQSPVVHKVKTSKEIKTKRPRAVSSSDDSDVIRKSKAIFAQSDSESEVEVKKVKKHSKSDKTKLKKTMKRSKNTPDKVIKQATTSRVPKEETVHSDMDLCTTPLNLEQLAMKKPRQHRKLSESGYGKQLIVW